MHFGASIFFTEYSIGPAALARALEERGFESLWVGEHSHIPLSRRSPLPGGGEPDKSFSDVMDPFVTLTAASAVTTRLILGTAVCLLIQRDTIQTAKAVASLDHLSGGRVQFGVGAGWNAEEMEDHGTVFATRFTRLREQVEALREIWTQDEPEYHGEIVDFPPMTTGPKPVQKPHPPILIGGAFPHAARRAIRFGDGWLPAGRSVSGDPEAYLPRFRQMAEDAGRDPASLPVTLGSAPENLTVLARYRELGVARMRISLPAAGAETILPVLDRWASLVRQLSG